MGSDSDWPVMQAAAEALAEFDVAHEADVVSAHRMPQEMLDYGAGAAERGLRVIIAGAGGAAHLPGMLAAVTPLPVIGVPGPAAPPRRARLAALDRADAGRRARGHRGGRRRPQRRACSPSASSRPPTTTSGRRMVDFQAELKATATDKGEAVRRASGGTPRVGF